MRENSAPFFLFLHYWDPHTPYLPPPGYTRMFYPKDRDPYDVTNHSMDEAWNWEPFKWYFHEWIPGVTDAEYVINLYDGETAFMDQQLRRIFAALETVREETLVILTADHGEILNEQQGYFDHHGLYAGNVHVPLIFSWPGTLPAGRRVAGFVQNVDLAPTLLEVAGVADNDNMEGISLLPVIAGEREGNYDELYLSEATWEVKRAIRTRDWTFINSIEQDPHGRPMQELYDLRTDPREQHNVLDTYPEQARALEAKLAAWVARRLQETGRTEDPARVQGKCGTRIGTAKPDEVIGAGATPLHKRVGGRAATIPRPDELTTAPNEVSDVVKGAPLHGYVKQ